MIRVVFFDLGMTLIDGDNKPFAHVVDALTAISSFKATDGKPLRSCLVSDFTLATPPVTVTALFNQYLETLDRTGLRPFFEPVKKRVTLSTHAGVLKPDRKIFEKALQRLGVDLPFEECLLVTENASHIDHVRGTLHMNGLRFRAAGSSAFDFDDWADAPALIANLVAPHHVANSHAAIKAYLAARGVDLLTSEPAETPGAMKLSGRVWSPISVPGFDELQGVHVAIPVEGEVVRGPKGEVRTVALNQPSAEQVSEASSYVRSLATHGQIAGGAAKRPSAATHEIETDEKGNRRLVRKRFTAF